MDFGKQHALEQGGDRKQDGQEEHAAVKLGGKDAGYNGEASDNAKGVGTEAAGFGVGKKN